jgi:hypothetical protein
MRRLLSIFILLSASLAATPLSASILTIGTSNHDTTIMRGGTGNSAGGQTQMYAGATGVSGSGDRALVSFDLTSLPAGAVIQSVQLTLTLSQVAGGGGGGGTPDPTPRVIDLYPIAQSWGEGTVNAGGFQGFAANTGDATWNSSASLSTAWTSAGVDGDPPTGTVSGSQTVGNTLGQYTWNSTTAGNSGMVSDVQAWVNSSAANFGWLLVNADENVLRTFRAFDTREILTSAAPQLTITFVPEPASSVIMGFAACALVGIAARRRPGTHRVGK